MGRAVDGEPGEHHRKTGKRLHRTVDDEIVEHESGHGEEDHRSDRIAEGAVGPRQVGMRDAQLDHAEHGEERACGEAELDEVEHRLEALGQQQHARDQELAPQLIEEDVQQLDRIQVVGHPPVPLRIGQTVYVAMTPRAERIEAPKEPLAIAR